MEMPVDVLNKRLGKIRDNGDIDFDNTMAAVDIDSELQEKFIFFPIEELEVLREQIEENRDGLYLGQGVGYATCPVDADPQDLLTRAENALVLYWELMERRKLTELEQEKLDRRPASGVYSGGMGSFTVIVPEDRRVLVLMDSGGFKDYSEQWDDFLYKAWNLCRINVSTGTIESS
jgi:hypothetical protein